VAGRVLIGTSGWHYDSWRGPFFPKGLPLKRQLQYYASQLPTTELNGVFYRTPTQAAVRDWEEQTGKDFVFAWKASRFITHWKRLSENSVNSLQLLEERLSLLGNKAGPVLFQLPPNFSANPDRLASFFKLLPRKRRYAFEFRHASWLTEPVYEVLREQNISLCVAESEKLEVPEVITADFVYYRLRKPDYTEADVDAIAARAAELVAGGRDLYLMFKHEETPEGALNAERVLRK